MAKKKPRCPWAVRFGATLASRCRLDADHGSARHEAGGLAQFPYQKVNWFRGDRREFLSDRDDVNTWTEPVDPANDSAMREVCRKLGIPYP